MKGDPAIEGFDTERIIPEAADGNQESKRLLSESHWMKRRLDTVSRSAARDSNNAVKAEEIRYHLLGKVLLEIDKVTNPGNISWAASLTAWLKAVAENFVKNVIRHRDVKRRHRNAVAHEHTIKLTDGKRTASLYSHSMSQEDEFLRGEQDALVPAIRRAARKEFRSLAPEDAQFVSLWVRRETYEEISAETGTARSTVAKAVKDFQKAVIKAAMKSAHEAERVAQLLADVNKHSEGVRELLANSLTETDLRGDGPRAGA